ncbi:MAG TPA: sigma-70 family RNA polymerase sigma factor [Candidatus Dormibacteraeota bacterium]
MTSTPSSEASNAVFPLSSASGAAEYKELEAELPRLMALAYSILHDREQASDAVQDTAEQAWRSWEALRQPDRRAAWLSTICVRQALRRARVERRQRLIRWRQRPEADGDLRVTDVDLGRALRRLSVRQRAVVGLHYAYGYSLDEVAAVLGCRPGTARSHLNRALATLRELMEVLPHGSDD